jgi:hypothetical protein
LVEALFGHLAVALRVNVDSVRVAGRLSVNQTAAAIPIAAVLRSARRFWSIISEFGDVGIWLSPCFGWCGAFMAGRPAFSSHQHGARACK